MINQLQFINIIIIIIIIIKMASFCSSLAHIILMPTIPLRLSLYAKLFLFNTAIYVFLLEEAMYSCRCICIHTVVYVFLDAATLTEVFSCFFLCCMANARV